MEMKRLIPLFLILCMTVAACGADPAETTLPDTVPPVQTTAPTEPSQTEETTVATTPTVPPETTVPTDPEDVNAETTTPVPFEPYTIRIEDPETLIFDGPAFRYSAVAAFEEAGVYTIVEESVDSDGNLWGRLKSGIGWVCLTDPPIVPIHAQFAGENFQAAYFWDCGETEYLTRIGILPNETLTDVKVTTMVIDSTLQTGSLLYTVDTLMADEPLLLQVVFYGDMTTYGISFVDAQGNERFYALSLSGKDGSLICSEYTP